MSRRRYRQPIQINNIADKMRAEGQCRLCWRKNRGSGGRELTKHRLVPGRHGGEYVVANVIPLCRRCHDDVEAQDASARRMLRPKLWPMEIAHAIKIMGDPWFELMYPKPAAYAVSLREADEAADASRGVRFTKKAKSGHLVGWEWIQANRDKWKPTTTKAA